MEENGPVAFWPPRTNWTLRAIPDWPSHLEVRLMIDSTAPMVVTAIEQACAAYGIELELSGQEPAAREATRRERRG